MLGWDGRFMKVIRLSVKHLTVVMKSYNPISKNPYSRFFIQKNYRATIRARQDAKLMLTQEGTPSRKEQK